MKKKSIWKRIKIFLIDDLEEVMLKIMLVFGSLFAVMACIFGMVFLWNLLFWII